MTVQDSELPKISLVQCIYAFLALLFLAFGPALGFAEATLAFGFVTAFAATAFAFGFTAALAEDLGAALAFGFTEALAVDLGAALALGLKLKVREAGGSFFLN